MMEKDTSADCLVLCLTYNNETEQSRMGARGFVYSHIKQFTQNLRDIVDAKLGREGGLRFLVAGEIGDRFKRVHWHVVLFAQVDLSTCGEWKAWDEVLTERADIVSSGAEKAKLRKWSLWRHGFVTAQEPDYGGMRYAMSYVVKDQFGIKESEGTAREASADFDSAGKFRQSRGTGDIGPIGVPFIRRHVDNLSARGAVDPIPRVKIPGRDFPWFVCGVCREELFDGYKRINDETRARTGRDCAGWAALVYSCRENEPDLKRLGVIEPEPLQSPEEISEQVVAVLGSARDNAGQRRAAVLRRQCGSTLPCDGCVRAMSDQEQAALGLVVDEGDGAVYTVQDWLALGGDWSPGNERDGPRREPEAFMSARQAVRDRQSDAACGGINPGCRLRDTRLIGRVFPSSVDRV